MVLVKEGSRAMNKEAATALEASIKHWERNVQAETPEDASTAAQDCALCQVYDPMLGANCIGCPVMRHTGLARCGGTPYRDAFGWRKEWLQRSFTGGLRATPSRLHLWETAREGWREAAQAELDFLKSLREPGLNAGSDSDAT